MKTLTVFRKLIAKTVYQGYYKKVRKTNKIPSGATEQRWNLSKNLKNK